MFVCNIKILIVETVKEKDGQRLHRKSLKYRHLYLVFNHVLNNFIIVSLRPYFPINIMWISSRPE